MRINAILTDDLLKQIDETAGEMGKSRSLFIREATERYLADIEFEKEKKARQKKRTAAVCLQDRLREKGGEWDSAAEIRKWRDKR
jgi:metal-responsive CopG/Arc/MetJ family transcriptional regulator